MNEYLWANRWGRKEHVNLYCVKYKLNDLINFSAIYDYGWCVIEAIGCLKNEKKGFEFIEKSYLGNAIGK